MSDTDAVQEAKRSRHRLNWEDSQMAALYYCEVMGRGVDGPVLHAGDEPEPCPACGTPLQLVWIVYAKEVGEPTRTDADDPTSR